MRRSRGISDDAAFRRKVRAGETAVAPAGEPGRRTGVPTAERGADDAGGRGGGVQSPEAGAGPQGLHADDRVDQHVQHSEGHVGRTQPAHGGRGGGGGCQGRPGRQLPVAASV